MEENVENNNNIKKIAVVGPESTGKSTLARQLAVHYKTVWVPEYARAYCEKLSAPCSWQDEINMFYGQLALEEEMLPLADRLLICDTTFLTVKIWSDHIFGRTHPEVLDALPKHPYDIYLLMDIDMPWQEDPLRDFPHLRKHFMDIWYSELESLKANYIVITGTGASRLQSSISAIDEMLLNPH